MEGVMKGESGGREEEALEIDIQLITQCQGRKLQRGWRRVPGQCATFCLKPEERLAGAGQAMHHLLVTAWSTDDRRYFLAFEADIYLTQVLTSGTHCGHLNILF